MKRVFVFSKQSLFSQGIRNLLDAEPELTVVGWESDPERALQCIKETRPDAILHITDGEPIPSLLSSEGLVRLGIKIKVVQISLEDSNVYVYQGERLTLTAISDLNSVI